MKGSALAASLILIVACGTGTPNSVRVTDCAPWSEPDGLNGYQHCVVTKENGNKYDCYKKPGDYFANCDKK